MKFMPLRVLYMFLGLFIISLLLLYRWNKIPPSMDINNIQITCVVEQDNDILDTYFKTWDHYKYGYTFSIQLNSDQPIIGDTYNTDIYLLIKDYPANLIWFKGEVPKGISRGINLRDFKYAIEKLYDERVISLEEKENNLAGYYYQGFSFVRDEFPVNMRLLSISEKEIIFNEAYIVISYYEKKPLKEFQITKTIPIDIDF
ncbi:hypothetical protein EDC18_101483 [Natranaerovirga pectinivora]|uniref:Uncharacterized protein n=1 Tax=Natranaerovirga pectinivora TaxID=682400 RepID=A0A4R3MPG8_9FIRM|nr:hypothetical protein [Natranaerovirga pectinivora]TCT17185.1 hypothetical protein EDC18_101483 [Natranaerovirga pectinivora]